MQATILGSPDKYGVWPTKDFTAGSMPDWFSVPKVKGALLYKGVRNGNVFNDSILLLHEGKLAFERYYGKWDRDTKHPMYSVTKSVVSALTGIAVAEGKIENADQKVTDFFPDAVIAPGQELKRDITIEHLLHMNSGLPGDSQKNDVNWWDAPDSGKAAFETPLFAKPGERFSYSSGPGCQTLAVLISRAVGQNLFEYAKEKLFGPLGMDSVEWDAAKDGNNYGGFGIRMTSRDMLRFGYLYLNRGRWENTQILPPEWVDKSAPSSKEKCSYGRLFWNTDFNLQNDSYQACGSFGQFICVLPERDAVLVRTGSAGPVTRFANKRGGERFERMLLSFTPLKGIPLAYFRSEL
ncbi:MAG: beta-lactamase family protein [Oscillospiraceae bacterium]|nr:beta-lactamase family protein [Oscillospiraceae bacterium]